MRYLRLFLIDNYLKMVKLMLKWKAVSFKLSKLLNKKKFVN